MSWLCDDVSDTVKIDALKYFLRTYSRMRGKDYAWRQMSQMRKKPKVGLRQTLAVQTGTGKAKKRKKGASNAVATGALVAHIAPTEAPVAPTGVTNDTTHHVAENENKNNNAGMGVGVTEAATVGTGVDKHKHNNLGKGVVEHENYDAVMAIEASDFSPQMKSDMAEDLEMSNIVDYAIDEESDDNEEHEENSSNCDDEAAFITSDL
eukprot:scaffold371290_cov48-Attheya_sp.AAC.1